MWQAQHGWMALWPLRWSIFEMAGISPVTRTRCALSRNSELVLASQPATPRCSNLSSQRNGWRKESRSLADIGPRHNPRGRKFPVLYLCVRKDNSLIYLSSGGIFRFSTRKGQTSLVELRNRRTPSVEKCNATVRSSSKKLILLSKFTTWKLNHYLQLSNPSSPGLPKCL